MKGNNKSHNCLICKDTFSFEINNINNQLNCYENCSYYYYFDNEGNYNCSKDPECPKEFSYLLQEKRECIKNCSKEPIQRFDFQKKCYEKCPPKSEESKEKELHCEIICDKEKPFELIETQECVDFCDISKILSGLCITKYKGNEFIEGSNLINKEEKDIKEEEIKLQDKFLDNIEKGFTSENYDTSNIEKGIEDIIQENKMTITLTTTDNQKNSENKNMTTINFEECEKLLRKAYKISDDKKLYMKKIDIRQDGMKISKTEYDVYCKLNGTNLIKLDLSYCSNTKIDLSVPVVINENIDKLNTSSGYYNDICYTATSDTGTDIPLKDRKNDFVKNNKTVCQENCDFIDYDYDKQKAKCSCRVKESSNSSAFMNINTSEIFNNFKDIKNIANVVILRCYHILFSKNGIKGNFGCYMIIPIIIMHFIFIIIFYKEQSNYFKKNIKKIMYGIKNWYLVKKEEEKKERLNKDQLRKEKQAKTNKSKKRKYFISRTNEELKEERKERKEKEENIIKILHPLDFYYLSRHPDLITKENGFNPPKKKWKKIINIKNNLNINNNNSRNKELISNNEINERKNNNKSETNNGF